MPKTAVFSLYVDWAAKASGARAETIARRLVEAGITGVDAEFTEFDTARALVGEGMEMACVYGDVAFLGPDGGRRAADQILDVAARLRSPQIMVLPDNVPETGDRDRALDAITKGLAAFTDEATKAGFKVSVEDFGIAQSPCSSIADLKRIFDAVPDLGFTLDTGNFFRAREDWDDVLDAFRLFRGRICHAHLKDRMPDPPRRYAPIGTGTIPNDKIVRELLAGGYRGWFTLEEHGADDILGATLKAARVLKSWVPCEWVKNPSNPVLGNTALGTCFDVNVVADGPAPFTMYFSWRPQKAIALVRSDNAISWTQEPEICLRADPASGWEDDLNRSCTVFKDGEWHMWYTGQSRHYTRSLIGYAKSSDGVKFERVSKAPVMVPETAFENQSVMNPYVRWDAARQLWRMWYAAGETYEPNVLCYAESPDGLNWAKFAGNPIFGKGAPGEWDCDRVGACEVHPLPDGTWAMFYIGYSDIDTARIGCAVSADGVTGWRRLAQNPLVAPTPGAWDASACYKPSVFRDEKKDRWMLWYNGRNGHDEYVGGVTKQGLALE